jgi:hypothetical protein
LLLNEAAYQHSLAFTARWLHFILRIAKPLALAF